VETNAPQPDSSSLDPSAVAEWRGLGDLFALATERLTAPVEGMHRAIADRWFGLAGPQAARLGNGYQTITSGIYGSVRLAGAVLGALVGMGAEAQNRRGRLRPLWRSPRSSGIQAVANAVWGDHLEKRGSPLRIEMGLRAATGRPIGADPDALARAFPHPTTRLVVLLHGLGETERCFLESVEGGETAGNLGEVLAADSFTPLFVRYNTGMGVSDNGRGLGALLDTIFRNWPIPVEEIALVGNSMGGLVARSAVYAGCAARHEWVETTRHLVAIATPHLGAPLEKGADLISRGLRIAPESRPIGEFLDHRSAGIKDLRFGTIQDVDQLDTEGVGPMDDTVPDVRFPEHVQQHFVAGVVTEDADHPIGVLVGDLIVRTASATGRGRRRTIDATHVRIIGKRRHSDLAGDPTVHRQVREWLATEPAT
jgi:pimeloyl-ACP methyl ester carboxylesterase